MILKIDLEKAFDKLEWTFIKDTLLFFGFYANLTRLIMSCVTTFSISILVNRCRTETFKPTTGSGRGPYVLLPLHLIHEKTPREIESEVEAKHWHPIGITTGGPKLSYLFFADDLTLLARANPVNCYTILNIL